MKKQITEGGAKASKKFELSAKLDGRQVFYLNTTSVFEHISGKLRGMRWGVIGVMATALALMTQAILFLLSRQ